MSRFSTKKSQAKKSKPFSLMSASLGFGLAQIFTKKVREFYERRYKKHDQKVLSRLIFIFDVSLVSIVVILICLVVYISFRSLTPSFVIRFQSSQFSIASPTPISVSIKAPAKSGLHRNVRAFWKLPSGVEIVEASPKILPDGSVYIGNLSDDQETQLHLIVRAYRPMGEKVIIGLQLQEGNLLDTRITYASVSEVIGEGGLFAEVPLDIQSTNRVVAHGAVIPIRVVNQTDKMIPFVEIRPTDSSTVLFSRQALGNLEPNEEKFVYIPLGDLEKSPVLSWSLVASSFEVVSSTWRADVLEWPNKPELKVATVLKQNATTTLDVLDGVGSALIAVSSAIAPTIQVFPVENDENHFAFRVRSSEASQYVYAAPFRILENGSRILGSAEMSVVVGRLPLKTSIRYTAVSGDQIGAGAHPPKLNEETRYWVFFSVDQTQTSLKNIHVRANLPKGVEFTGLIAVPDGGTWTNTNQVLDWKLPMPVSSKARVVIGAEISILPTVESLKAYELLSSVTAEAIDVESGVSIEADQGGVTTEDVDK